MEAAGDPTPKTVAIEVFERDEVSDFTGDF